MREEISQLVSQ